MTEQNTSGIAQAAHLSQPTNLLQSAKDWRKRGRLESVLGHKIFIIDQTAADKPTLVLIHGFPTSSWDWHGQFDQLAEHYRLIAIDMLGFGFSDKPKDYNYSIMEQADIHESILRHRGISQYSILAHDYGDTVAQELLARHLGNKLSGLVIERLVLLNGGLFPEVHRARLMQKLLLGPLGPLISLALGKGTLDRNLTAVFAKETAPSEELLEAFWYLIELNQGHRVLHRLMAYMSDRLQHRERWVGALQNSDIPMALINGLDDPVSGAHMVERYKELVGSEHIVELPGIGHYPQVEAPIEVLKHALEFLQEGKL